MDSNVNLIAFGTFGSPNGFRQTFFVGNEELAKSIKTFDLNTNAIKLFANTKIYAIRKEYASGFNTISYSVYSYAKEPTSERSGTFIGSSILFSNKKIALEQITISCLNEFHSNLTIENVQNGTISVNHSDSLVVKKPEDFDKMDFNLRDVENLNFLHNLNRILVVFCKITDEHLSEFFKKAVDLLNVYDTIYFTDSSEVAEFVHNKGIFKLIQNVGNKLEFEQEIQNLFEERKLKKEQTISDFEREIQRLEDDKHQTLNEFKLQIEQSERVHQQNELKIKESKKDLESVEQIYSDFEKKIKELVDQLTSGRKLEEVKQVYNENKNHFIDGVNQIKNPIYVNKLPRASAKSSLQVEHQYLEYEGDHHSSRNREEKEEYRIGIFKVATFILLLLLIGTWLYFLFFNSKEESESIQIQQQEISVQPEPIPMQTTTTPFQELNPKPNSELNENDYRLTAKKLKYNTKADDVVKIIFDNNPTDIKENYVGQEGIYSKHLIELNQNCFEEKNGVFYFEKDTLRHIPSFKK